MSFSCVVLCGGKSVRMGRNKAFIKVNGTFIVDIVIGEMEKISKNIVLVVDKKEKYAQISKYESVKIVEDEHRDFGPVEGMRIGLKAAEQNNVFVCACDMPLIRAECIEEVYTHTDEKTDCVIPAVSGKIHTLHGFYKKRTVEMLEFMVENDKRRIKYLLDRVKTKLVKRFECDIYESVSNINDKNDIDKIKERGVVYE